MKDLSETVSSGFSLGAVLVFCSHFVCRIYGVMTRRIVFVGPDKLCEIPWIQELIIAIVSGIIFGICFYEMEKVEKRKGKEVHIPRIKFKNFGLAILSFSILFFGFIFIFVIREYHVRMAEVSYMFRKTFLQFCSTHIPWLEIVVTSLIFGIILALGFSTTEQKQENKIHTQHADGNK